VDSDAAVGLLDLTQVIRRGIDLHRTEVLLQMRRFRGARDRNDPRLLREEPGEIDLGGCGLPDDFGERGRPEEAYDLCITDDSGNL